MEFKIVNPIDDSNWDERLLGHVGATAFHTAAWARVLGESYGYHCCYLLGAAGEGTAFLLPIMDVRSRLTGNRGVALPFTDFCEPLFVGTKPVYAVRTSLSEMGRQRHWRYYEIRGGEGIFSDFTPSMTLLSHTLDLSSSEEALYAGLKESTRRNNKKARREGVGVAIGTSAEMVESFYRLNCYTRREHGLPPQPIDFFRNLHRHVIAKGQGIVALATVRDQEVGGAIYLHFGRNALFKYGASNARFLLLRPNDLVMWEAIRWYRERDFRSLCFGRTEHNHEGLRRYKLAWGVKEQEKPYYRYDFATAEFRQAKLGGGRISSHLFRHLPLNVSRLLGKVLYRHVA